MSDTVEVVRSASGEWWRMTYRGESQLVDEEPNEKVKATFVRQVNDRAHEARGEAQLRAAMARAEAAGHDSSRMFDMPAPEYGNGRSMP